MKNSIKIFLIDGKSFFDLPVKNKEEAYEKVIEISRNNVYQLVIYWTMDTFGIITNWLQ